MKAYPYALFMVTLFASIVIHAHKDNGDNGVRGNPNPKSKSKGHKKGKPDWPCFSTTIEFESTEETESTDYRMTSTWASSKGKKPKPGGKHPRKPHPKKPCRGGWWDTSSTYTTEESEDDMDTTDTDLDCESYSEGCSTMGQFVPPGVCCVYPDATCVSCEQEDLCDESSSDIACECYVEDDCPIGCESRCIGLSQALSLDNVQAPAIADGNTGALKADGGNTSTNIEPIHTIEIVIAVCVVLLVCAIGGVYCVCKKRRSGKYSSVNMEDHPQNGDMETVNIATCTDTGIAQVNGEESVMNDESVSVGEGIVLPDHVSRTNMMADGDQDVALTASIDW